MNRALPLLATPALLLATIQAVAQCPFDPTVTPSDLILCPNSQGELSTQVYDSYQWYKAGEAIVGATGPTLTVNAFNDAAYMFKVEATLNGCTEMSPEVLVDGWAFAGATIMTTGAEPLYFSQNGPVYCGLDTVLLIMMPPFNTNVQWLNNGQPIPGATDDTLVVTTQGNFTANGAPAVCPGFVQNPGVEVGILFTAPTQPMLMMGDASICVMPEGVAYQWYLNGAPIAGDTPCIMADVAGTYTVNVTYDPDCSLPADPLVITGVAELEGIAPRISPMPAQDAFTISALDAKGIGSWLLLDATGRIAIRGNAQPRPSVHVDVRELNPGAYWLRAEGYAAVPVLIVR